MTAYAPAGFLFHPFRADTQMVKASGIRTSRSIPVYRLYSPFTECAVVMLPASAVMSSAF